MKKTFTLILLLFTHLLLFEKDVNAQCGAGYTAAQLNWDHLDFLPSNNTRYTSFYPSSAFPYNQNFMMGTRRVNFTMSPQANFILNGENNTNTAHTGSFATAGDDVQFITNTGNTSTITITFDDDVRDVRFSVFDLDSASQRLTITALNSGGVSQNVTMAKANASSFMTITGSGTPTAVATGTSGNYASNDNRGTLNVTINGPVSEIRLALNNRSGNIWLSDINACVTGSFPNNYQQISRPFTGQPQYVLTVVNNNTYYTDPTSGRAYFLFNEPGHDRLNSMAYDPYRRVVYYTYSLTDRYGLDPAVDKVLKKYDVDSKTISVVIPNVNSFGIPTYESGVESGAATFYNGSLYLGIEGYTGENYAAARKSTIWKIDFDAAGNAVPPAAQVWGVTADNGSQSQNIHDWSDFTISNGILYDFDGSGSGDVDFFQFDMFAGSTVNYIPAGSLVPRQVSIGWNEDIYNVDASISRYNGTTGVGTLYTIWSPLGPTIPTGSGASWGDAAGPYRPFLDFGDAPATYDPDPWSPACHDTLTPTISGSRRRLRLGPNEDVEWLKRGLTTVEDNYEDGLSFVPIFSPVTGAYQAQVSVFNNTNANAIMRGWLDYNANGLFDAGESSLPVTVPSSGSTQLHWLSWPSVSSSLMTGAITYLRIRITTASYGMTASQATGYYDTGEVEDYLVFVDNTVLSIPLSSFDAVAQGNSRVKLTWTIQENGTNSLYLVERSRNGTDWEAVGSTGSAGAGLNEFTMDDNQPYTGNSYYRLMLITEAKPARYSAVRPVRIAEPEAELKLYPNPAVDRVTLTIPAATHQSANIRVVSMQGTTLWEENLMLTGGNNLLELPLSNCRQPGVYFIRIQTGQEVVYKKLVVQR